MPSTPTNPVSSSSGSPSPSPRLAWVAAGLGTVLLIGLLLAAFWLGRESIVAGERRLIDGNNYGETLLGALEAAKTSDAEVAGILRVYGKEPSDRAFLRTISWVPPAVPAPFVGHLARPGVTANARINRFGFRDDRQDYPDDPDIYRVFVTGGSTAFGSGAPDQDQTIAALLERFLAESIGGRRVEVVNAAYPAWTTTQERLLITQRLLDLAPDRIVMFSGNNDVHWGLSGHDVAFFRSYADEHFMNLLVGVHDRVGFPDLRRYPDPPPAQRDCRQVAARAAENVRLAAVAAERVGAELAFVLQPNIQSTGKKLSAREQAIRDRAGAGPEGAAERIAYWQLCYDRLRADLSAIALPNYRFVDLSSAFGEMGSDLEVFLDSYHFGGTGNAAVVSALFNRLSWPGITRN